MQILRASMLTAVLVAGLALSEEAFRAFDDEPTPIIAALDMPRVPSDASDEADSRELRAMLAEVATAAGAHDWAVAHCPVSSIPPITEDGALAELLPRFVSWQIGEEAAGRRLIAKAYRSGYEDYPECHPGRDQQEVEFVRQFWLAALIEYPKAPTALGAGQTVANSTK